MHMSGQLANLKAIFKTAPTGWGAQKQAQTQAGTLSLTAGTVPSAKAGDDSSHVKTRAAGIIIIQSRRFSQLACQFGIAVHLSCMADFLVTNAGCRGVGLYTACSGLKSLMVITPVGFRACLAGALS